MGGLLINVLLSKIKKYKVIMIMTTFGLLLSQTFSVYGIMNGSVYLSTTGFTLFGFFYIGLISVTIELGGEITYPIDEIYSQSYLNVSKTIFSNIFIPIASELIDNLGKDGAVMSLYMCIGFSVLGFLFSLFIKEDLKRTQYENGNSFLESKLSLDLNEDTL